MRAKRAKIFGEPLRLATGAAVFLAGSEEGAGFGFADGVAEGVGFGDARAAAGAVFADYGFEQSWAVFMFEAGEFAFGGVAVGDADQRD